MLRAQDVAERLLDINGVRRVSVRHTRPREEGELLRRVGVPVRDREQPVHCLVVDSALGAVEPVGEVRLEGRLRQATDRHLPGTSPERLVPVVEQRLEHVALAAEVGVTDLGLGLEHGAHPVRQGLVEPYHLLELVEHEHRPSLSLRPELPGQLQQPVDRVVDVLPPSARGEGEADVRPRAGRSRSSAAPAATGRAPPLARSAGRSRRSRSSRIVFASADAKRSFVGVRIRSQ